MKGKKTFAWSVMTAIPGYFIALGVGAIGLVALAPTASAHCVVNAVGSDCPDGDCTVNAVGSSCTDNGFCHVNAVGSTCDGGQCPVNVVFSNCGPGCVVAVSLTDICVGAGS